MTVDLDQCCWPVSKLGDALVVVAHSTGLLRESTGAPDASPNVSCADNGELTRWMRSAVAAFDMEPEVAEITYSELERSLPRVAPALIKLPGLGESCFLPVIGGRKGLVRVLSPDLVTYKLPVDQIRRKLCMNIDAQLRQNIEQILNAAGPRISKQERETMCAAILQDQLGGAIIPGVWLLRPSPSAPFFAQIRNAGLFRPITGLISSYAIQYILGILAWWIMGYAVIEGRLDAGWLVAWALVILTCLPFQLLTTWYQGLSAIGAGALLKRRLLYGALRLEPEEIRSQGAGHLLGRVIESEALESLALNAGFAAVLAIVELLVASVVIVLGSGGWLEAALFLGWIVFALCLGWGLWTRCIEWTKARLALTHDLVEKMVGHRSRLAQARDEQWHQDEDPMLARYLEVSRSMDERAALISALVPQGWLILGVMGLAPTFVEGTSSSAKLAVGLGGILLASGALQRISLGFSSIAGASIAWTQVSLLFGSAARGAAIGSPAFACADSMASDVADPDSTALEAGRDCALLEARDLVFHYPSRNKAVLDGVSLRVHNGDRILLEGPSGSGKSALAALLCGLRTPQSGTILWEGLDRNTYGSAGWHRRVGMVPQFHENYVFTGTFAFNLLMGRSWPPKSEDLVAAEAICRELGLDDLLERMPAGLSEMLGESGWQLSHSEKSRLFLARTLLQKTDLIILDECLSTLDPDNFFKALRCAYKNASALIVIAHP
jgi:ATP-binding cassette, subfamily B, bacterial